ncbi:MAG: hypothetical protein SWC96_04575 [Thermodesulfobacteriota bacterium]|nr:hypothetical protein [Thermodesulfobacteriota bacterium]
MAEKDQTDRLINGPAAIEDTDVVPVEQHPHAVLVTLHGELFPYC